jgi:hypothetical protein
MKPLMMRSLRYLLPATAIFLCLFSCKKIEKMPAIPLIEFQTFEVFDSTDILGNPVRSGRLKFYFQDGDGDLGLKSPGNLAGGADSVNLFLKLYRKTDGEYTETLPTDPLKPSGYRIPYMTRLGQNKLLKGTITVTMLYYGYQPTDTIKYDFYIKDRAEHHSNTVTTCEIILQDNGFCNQ